LPRSRETCTLAVFSDPQVRLPDETYRYAGHHISEYDRTKWIAHYHVAEPMMEAGLPLVIAHSLLDGASSVGYVYLHTHISWI